jgi:4-aminobutyrate aminotransferase/(S)-3-amino-2-methylpropionate transaminase
MAQKYPVIGDIRGMGAMMAMELVSDQKAKTPAAKEAKAAKVAAFKKGMVLLTCGTYDNVIRMHPSMVMPDEILEQAMDILDASLGEATKG